jgi:hypothetical protein
MITAAIVVNRAEDAWRAPARIHERSACAQLREHIGKNNERKAQLLGSRCR